MTYGTTTRYAHILTSKCSWQKLSAHPDFTSLSHLVNRFSDLGADRVFFKCLSENDNSKQQIYLGGSFEVLSFFPHGTVTAYPGLSEPNFKAALDLFWASSVSVEQAPNAQLILYPQYPEVRLSGFLRGCETAPSAFMQPIPKEGRRGIDGRVLFFGVTKDRKTLAYLGPAGSPIALEAYDRQRREAIGNLFTELPVSGKSRNENRWQLLDRLREINRMGFVPSVRMDRNGNISQYMARNGGGYTLEALLGVRPNAEANPDYLGWEVKAFSKSNITLMTPEPNGGIYGNEGAASFIRQFGHVSGEDQLYFTGAHRFGQRSVRTGLMLELKGFDPLTGKVTDVDGAIQLTDGIGRNVASWGFAELLTHWNRKHASAVFVQYASRLMSHLPEYAYLSPVSLGEHTDFGKCLAAIADGSIIFDPGSKLDRASTPRSVVKARSQFRVRFRDLAKLYDSFESVAL